MLHKEDHFISAAAGGGIDAPVISNAGVYAGGNNDSGTVRFDVCISNYDYKLHYNKVLCVALSYRYTVCTDALDSTTAERRELASQNNITGKAMFRFIVTNSETCTPSATRGQIKGIWWEDNVGKVISKKWTGTYSCSLNTTITC